MLHLKLMFKARRYVFEHRGSEIAKHVLALILIALAARLIIRMTCARQYDRLSGQPLRKVVRRE